LSHPLDSSADTRDTFTLLAISGKAAAESAARDKLLDELIAQGWGNTPPDKIPGDWRNRRGRDDSMRPEKIAERTERLKRPSTRVEQREGRKSRYWRTDQPDGGFDPRDCPTWPNLCRCIHRCTVCRFRKHSAMHRTAPGEPPNGRPRGHRFEPASHGEDRCEET
jgi:hypothetical protein